MSWNLENGLLLCCQLVEFESLSPGLKYCRFNLPTLVRVRGFLAVDSESGLWSVVLTELGSGTSPDSFWDVLVWGHETRSRELLVPQRWLNCRIFRNSSPGLFRFTPRTLDNGGELLKHNFFILSIIGWLRTFQFFPSGKPLVVVAPCDLIC